MADPTRILFITDEIAPFTEENDVSSWVRRVPELVHDTGDFETRIMMPRYGTVSERRNRLHEVIRLSGNPIELGDQTETLRVKVASIPGIRLQVYFMDNTRLFKRKGIYRDRKKDDQLFDDNPERALYYCKAVFQTIRNLGWKPDIIHAVGYLSGMAPYLLKHEAKGDEILGGATILYSPVDLDFEAGFTADVSGSLGLSQGLLSEGATPVAYGVHYADHVVTLGNVASSLTIPGALVAKSADDEDLLENVRGIYEGVR